ncbi:UvrD-helicase domain-containing protein [Halomarina ordinaria]|uniref:DNA 3'-5' helicase n=1 Tax=Halomarina ordinaria TaxID=3033939 RepID=A0ABD5UA68_9EURY|nr:ATP-dependent helicase [Halomarina sp. PSRA2]
MTEVVKIDGAPGAGKTTALVGYVSSHAKSGYSLDDCLYLTFTRAARTEVADRLHEVFPEESMDTVKKHARTFHGAALSSCLRAGGLDNPREQVITPVHNGDIYEGFCRDWGFEYAPEMMTTSLRARVEGRPESEPTGNKVFRLAEHLALTRRDAAAHVNAPISLPLSSEEVHAALEAWKAYKAETAPRPLFEHHDYVNLAIDESYHPQGRVLFIDEFQDLSPQEYALFREWRDSGGFDVIYLAGDANQSIYSFREATPALFERMPVDRVETLNESYRVPSAITIAARSILRSHPANETAGLTSAREGGTVQRVVTRDASRLGACVRHALDTHTPQQGVAVFVLGRTNRHVRSLAAALRREGIPYTTLNQPDLWTEELTRLYEAICALRDGAPVPTVCVRALLEALPHDEREWREQALFGGKALQQTLSDPSKVFEYDVVRRAFPEPTADLIGRFVELGPKSRTTLLNASSSPTTHVPTHLQLGTIHAVKGLEAPCVLLSDAYTKRLKRTYATDERFAAEEHRLYYVGSTRASESLYIVSGYGGAPMFPGFRGGIPTSVGRPRYKRGV